MTLKRAKGVYHKNEYHIWGRSEIPHGKGLYFWGSLKVKHGYIVLLLRTFKFEILFQ